MLHRLVAPMLLLAGLASPARGAAYRLADLNRRPAQDPSALPLASDFATAGSRLVFATTWQWPERQSILWSTGGGDQPPRAIAASDLSGFAEGFRSLGSSGRFAYFLSGTGVVWRTDGTASGSFPVTPPSVGVGGAVVVQDPSGGEGCLYLIADPPGTPPELWRSDGSRQGTHAVGPFQSDADPERLYSWRGQVYFAATTPGEGRNLWMADASGTHFARLGPVDEPGGEAANEIVGSGSRIFYTSDARQLWVSDGTATGTHPAATFASAFGLRAFGDGLTLLAGDDARGFQLWRSDGTSAGTRQISDLPAGNLPDWTSLTRIGKRWVFLAYEANGSSMGLWTSSDGSGTANRVSGCPQGCPTIVRGLIREDGSPENLLFWARDTAHGVELWSTDGTGAGTRRLADACPGACDGFTGSWSDVLGAVSGRAYFRAARTAPSAGRTDQDLWVSDGTREGTGILAHAIVGGIGTYAGQVVFGRIAGHPPASELWTTDGSPGETRRAATVIAGEAAGSFPLFWSAGRTALIAALKPTGDGLWISDGTPAGTVAVPSNPASAGTSFFAGWSAPAGGKVFFERDLVTGGRQRLLRSELWASDGTLAGTLPIALFTPVNSIDSSTLTDWMGKLLFVVLQRQRCAIWTSDGSPRGTRQLFAMPDGVRCPTGLHALGTRFVFVSRIETPAGPVPQLFLSDGTLAGTSQLSDIAATREAFDNELCILGGSVYFLIAGEHSSSGMEVWRSDGTRQGTHRVLTDLGFPGNLTAWRGTLYLTAILPDYDSTRSLVRWDGVAAAPTLLAAAVEDYNGNPWAEDIDYTPAGPLLFFTAHSATELWRSDGTAQGTRRTLALAPSHLTNAGDRIFFVARDGRHGSELWTSDGTTTGTRLVQDILPGFLSSQRAPSLAVAGNHLFFAADDGVAGVEPWALSLDELRALLPPR